MAEFNMKLRGREVHIVATIQSMDPIAFTIEIHDKETLEYLNWDLSRGELKEVLRNAAASCRLH